MSEKNAKEQRKQESPTKSILPENAAPGTWGTVVVNGTPHPNVLTNFERVGWQFMAMLPASVVNDAGDPAPGVIVYLRRMAPVSKILGPQGSPIIGGRKN